MKRIFRATILAVFVMMCTTILSAQEVEVAYPTPKWISEKGYWIVESNLKTPETALIHFYNQDNIVIYSEKVQGIRLNLKKRRTLMRLKRALEQSLIGWEQTHLVKENADLVNQIFNGKHRSW